MHVQYEMIPCSGLIEEVQNVRTSTRCVLFSPKLVHVLPPSVELWKLRFYKKSNISIYFQIQSQCAYYFPN